ncbi:UNVERIFIED_CONTAM: Echinoderm microtubule-associated protein-like 1 [Gekko kuhli]
MVHLCVYCNLLLDYKHYIPVYAYECVQSKTLVQTGVWPEGSDGTDINAVCRSQGRKLLSTGDDFGKVHLFSYPCSQFRAPSHVYGGHSSHVTNVDFLHEDTHLISTGGKDTSIMQWRVI